MSELNSNNNLKLNNIFLTKHYKILLSFCFIELHVGLQTNYTDLYGS